MQPRRRDGTRRTWLHACACLVALAVWRADASEPSAPRADDRLLDLAAFLPAEFKADVLIRLADARALPRDDLARPVLEDAFMAAGAAQTPLRLDIAIPDGTIGRADYYRARALATQLDQLTLQTRALRDLAEIDAERARELEGWIRIELPPLACEDTLAHNVDDAYRNLTPFVAALPSADRFLAVQRYIAAMSSSVQIAPVAELLARVALTSDDRASLARAFAFALQRIDDGDRAFGAAEARERTPQRIEELASVLLREAQDPGDVVDGVRSWLVNHFSARRCADGGDAADLRLTQWFNGTMTWLTARAVPTIEYANDPGRRLGGTHRVHEFTDSAQYLTLVNEITAAFGPDRNTVALLPAWKPFLKTPEGVVGDVLVWHGSTEPMREFLLKKALLLETLLNHLSRRGGEPGLDDAVLGEWIGFLAATSDSTDDRLAWFLQFDTLLEYARRSPRLARVAILDAVERSGNPVMSAYAAVERIAPKRALRE